MYVLLVILCPLLLIVLPVALWIRFAYRRGVRKIQPRTLRPAEKLREAQHVVSSYPTAEQIANWDELGDIVKQRNSDHGSEPEGPKAA